VIRSFADKETQRVWEGQRSRRLPPEIQETALRKLQLVAAAKDVTDLRVPPGNSLEALKRDRKGQWSIRISSKWRICFKWKDGHAEEVEICDYH
jgi:proteic killer suppression protein